jgi:hypothetical protein
MEKGPITEESFSRLKHRQIESEGSKVTEMG